MPDPEHPMWVIVEDLSHGWVCVWRTNGYAADSEGPTLASREEFDEFMADLQAAGDRTWPT